MKLYSSVMGLLLLFVMSSGCEEEWKTDSCHIIHAEMPAAVTCPAPTEHSHHWLEALQTLGAKADPVQESKPAELKRERRASAAATAQPKLPVEPGSCVDINHADEKQLATLPGVGTGRAQKIIQLREKRPFKRKPDIMRIKGIGKKSYQKMAAFICDIRD